MSSLQYLLHPKERQETDRVGSLTLDDPMARSLTNLYRVAPTEGVE